MRDDASSATRMNGHLHRATETQRKLAGNILWLYVLQGLNYAIPIIVLPYLIRVLGVERYGSIAFAQAFAQYFTIATDYGFNFSATKQVARIRGERDQVSRLFWAVMFIKAMLMCAGIVVLVAIVQLVPRFHQDELLYVLAYVAVVGSVLFPAWLFQGMEQMRYISIITGSARVMAMLLLFVFVRRPSDYLAAVSIQSAGTLLAGCIGFAWAVKSFAIRRRLPSRSELSRCLQDGWHLFLSTAAVTMYTNTNVFLVGILAGNTQAGLFSAAEKLIRAIQGLLLPVTQAIYPHINSLVTHSREAAVAFIRKTLWWFGALTFIPCVLLFVVAHPLVLLAFGRQALAAVPIVRWMCMLPFVIALSNVLGIQTMITFGMEKQFSRILIGAGLINLALAVPLIMLYAAPGAGMAVLIAEVFVTASMWIVLQRKGIDVVRAVRASA